ncbi:MAG: site-2 protease family protein [Clostridiales Family XIII bacterium]|jgi:Zn-dependent protease|nr:site-2 protease family protein [Clostridiales Family XIII bacterium]
MRKAFSGNYIMVVFMVIMAYNAFSSGRYDNFGDWLTTTLLRLPGIVIGITVHEFAHAFSAWKLGDQTPKAQGRVTLNPLAHIDPVGIIALLFVGFGWGRPVQVNPYAFTKNRRLANIITDVAGVATNFVIAFFCTAALFVVHNETLFTILLNVVYMNLVLMIFNLLPIPPLDGFGIITEIFDLRRFRWYKPFYSNGTIILLILIVFDIISGLLGPALSAILGFIQNVWALVFY